MQDEFGSVQGGIGHSGVRIDPRKKEDPDFNPPSLKSLREFQFQSPTPQPSQQQYTPPEIMPGLGGAIPDRDFSPEAAQARFPTRARAQMPQAPGARIQMPVYEEPERPGKWRTALGIGLSGMAGLGGPGQAARASDQFFLEPERRAERDYARDVGTYEARESQWSQYYNDMMAADKYNLSVEEFEERKRATGVEEDAPFAVSRGAGVWDPVKKEMIYEGDNLFGGGSQWEFQTNEALNYWLAEHPGRTREDMTFKDRDDAITQFRRRRGLETTVPGYDKDGNLINMPRSDSYYGERPETYWDESGQLQYRSGRTDVRPRPPVVDEVNIAGVDEWIADEKRKARRAHQTAGLQLLAPLPGSPEREAFDKALDDELAAIEAEGLARKERLRSGTIAPGPGETRVLQYNVETGRAE